MNDYEIQYQCFGPDYQIEGEIATLTGLEFEDILMATKGVTHWSGQAFVKVFRKLGFNTNRQFIKFDKETEWPCMMRTKKPFDKKYWYGFVYFKGLVYVQYYGPVTWAEWNKLYPNYRITSMLQVWI
jgi:hypothetical protein